MNIWLILWIVLSVVLIGIFVWSNQAILDQKKAWKLFAQRHKFKYIANSFLKSPVVSKKGKETSFQLFSEEQITSDLAKRRFTTVFEWTMPAMPINGIIASSEMKNIVDAVNVTDRIEKPSEKWSRKDWIVVQDAEAFLPYLTEERTESIIDVMQLPSVRFLFAFDTSRGVVRVETNDPLLEEKKITKIFQTSKSCVEKLIPQDKDFEACRNILDEKAESSSLDQKNVESKSKSKGSSDTDSVDK